MQARNEIEAGELYINSTPADPYQGYHAGWKRAGLGGHDGKHGMLEFTQTRLMVMRYGGPGSHWPVDLSLTAGMAFNATRRNRPGGKANGIDSYRDLRALFIARPFGKTVNDQEALPRWRIGPPTQCSSSRWLTAAGNPNHVRLPKSRGAVNEAPTDQLHDEPRNDGEC